MGETDGRASARSGAFSRFHLSSRPASVAAVDLQSVIALPPAGVYAALCDVERRPALDPTITVVEPCDGEVLAGSTFSGTGALTGDESSFEALVTALEA